jgi:hypothetical protein
MGLRLLTLLLVAALAGTFAVVSPNAPAAAQLDVAAVPGTAVAAVVSCPLPNRYLRMMLDRFESTDLALAAYNAGPTAVEARGATPNDETVAYVQTVTARWRKLVGCV